MTIQQRVPDPTGMNARGVWVSPLRDVAHSFPFIVKDAFTAMEVDLNDDNNDMMCKYAMAVGEFVSKCTGPESPTNIRDLYKETGLLEFPDAAHQLFGKWLARAMLGFYFKGIKEAMHPGETPIGLKELTEGITEMCAEGTDDGSDK